MADSRKSGLPLLIGGMVASALIAGLVAYVFTERSLAHPDTYIHILRTSGLIAIPLSGAVLAAIIWAANRFGRPFNGNLAMLLVLGVAIATPIAVISVDQRLQAGASAKTEAVVIAARQQVLAAKQTYDNQLTALRLGSLNTPAAIKGGGAAIARDHMAQALQADARLQAQVDAIVSDTRPKLAAVPVSGRQRAAALKAFDLEFDHAGAGVKLLTATQTARLEMMNNEVTRLSTRPWHNEGRYIVFADGADQTAYATNHNNLLRIDNELERQAWEFRQKAGPAR